MNRVSIGVVANDGKVLLIKRKKQEGALLWQFPGGQVESYETSAEAAVREVNEETGIVCSPLLSLGQRMHPNTNIEIHYWICEYIAGEAFAKAPDEVSFLRYPHRHMFKCKAEIEVKHNDRELEFFMVKKFLEEETKRCLDPHYASSFRSSSSCEVMAMHFLTILRLKYGKNRKIKVEVWEDGENGARVKV